MRSVAIVYFFAIAAITGFAVYRAYRLQAAYRHDWLPSYTLYLGCWSALALLSIVQYVLAPAFVPGAVLPHLITAASPLWATTLAVALYFLSAFMAGLTGGRLSRTYRILYVSAWAAAAVVIAGASRRATGIAIGVSLALFVLKTGTTYGWIARALLVIRRLEDPLERKGLERFVLLFLAGCLAFDLAVRNATALVGIRTSDAAIGFVQGVMNYPALLWLERFLRSRALARPALPRPPDMKAGLAALGLSAREADVIELVLAGLSHKEVGDRLSIAPDTVKKHTYNVYRKLGVQNRVQLSYLVQNRRAGG